MPSIYKHNTYKHYKSKLGHLQGKPQLQFGIMQQPKTFSKHGKGGDSWVDNKAHKMQMVVGAKKHILHHM